MIDLSNKLDYAEAVMKWLLDLGEEQIQRGNLEAAAKYTHIASMVLENQNRDLASVFIEGSLRSISAELVRQGVLRQSDWSGSERPQNFLHVVSEALPAGGLTAMVRRWIKLDDERTHSVAFLQQKVPVPESLRQTVEGCGGAIHMADLEGSFVDQAAWLRALAMETADCVVLHVGLSDVVCGLAFGTVGGPPVMLVNHAAHLYWNGASIVDQVVNCRGSKLEVVWSASYRGVGISRCAIVPIPLEEDPISEIGERLLTSKQLFQKRQELGIGPNSFVVLTVGSKFKYTPVAGLDFTEVWKRILKTIPNAELLAVGFNGDQRWKDASAQVGNRIRTLGTMPQSSLLELMSAVDLYAEGFPFGTTTALLEAGLRGVAVALAPAQSPPPYGTDGIALDEVLQRPETVAEYQAGILKLYNDKVGRTALAKSVQEQIRHYHTGAGWKEQLRAAIDALPRQHTISPEITPVRTPPAVHTLWSAISLEWAGNYGRVLETATTRALALGLRPRVTPALREASRSYHAVRRGQGVSIRVLTLLLNVALPLLPDRSASRLFRVCIFFFRGSLVSRVWKKISSAIAGKENRAEPFQEYRQMREVP